MKRTHRLSFVLAALCLGLGLSATVSQPEPTGPTGATGTPATATSTPAGVASGTQTAPPKHHGRRSAPRIVTSPSVSATGPVEFSRPTPNAVERPRAATLAEAEERFDAALDRIERSVASVTEFGNPVPAQHERGSIIDEAVGAYLDIAEHAPKRQRLERYREMREALAILSDVGSHGDF